MVGENKELVDSMTGEKTSESGIGLGREFSMDMLIENPILKPISDKDNSLRSLDDLISTKLQVALNIKKWLNAAIDEIPEYRDSSFVTQLLNLKDNIEDVIRMQDIELKSLKLLIKEIVEIVEQRYTLDEKLKDEKKQKKEIPFNFKDYLKSLNDGDNPVVKEISNKILDLFILDQESKNDEQKFARSCALAWKNETDVEKKRIASSILKREIKINEKGGAG